MATQVPSSMNLVVIGEGGVGKSSCTLSFLRKGFSDEWDPTVEDCYTARTPVQGYGVCDVTIVDTAGQEEYRGLWGDSQIRDGDGFLFVFDTTNRASLEQLPSFIHQVRKVKLNNPQASTAHTPENNPFPFIVLGNKTDLHELRQISTQEGLNFARAGGGLFVETSAKLHANVDNAFQLLIKAVLKGRAVDTRHRRSGSGSRLPFSPNIQMVETFNEKVAAMPDSKDPQAFSLARENSEFEDSHGNRCCVVS